LTRVILGIGAMLAAAVALAGCGGGVSANGTTVGTTMSGGTTTSGVAGAQTTKGSASFHVRVTNLRNRIRQAMQKLRNGNVTGAAAAGGTLLTNCRNIVNNQLAPKANSTKQRQAVSHLRTACDDMSKAATKAASGDMATTKQLAQQALDQAQQAVMQLKNG